MITDLEPDLDVSLRESEQSGQLDSSSPGDVLVEVKLLLQLQQLCPGVGRPRPLVLVEGRRVGSCEATDEVLGFNL